MPRALKNYTVYILKCRDGSLYTGIAVDLKRRLAQHAAGKASKYTRGKLPVRCVYAETNLDGTTARKREYAIKQWNRSEKLALIRRSRIHRTK